MKIICPKCQYENQADSTRVVCARCATIIEVKQDPGIGFDVNGKRQTARLPFVGNVGNSQPLNNPQNPPTGTPANRDVYATRVGDEFDDVLDIPRQPQPSYQAGNEPTTAFEDVFAMPNYDTPTSYDYGPQERKPTAPIEGFPTGQNTRQRETQDYGTTPEPEFMGWPVLPENSDDDQEQIGGYPSNRGALVARVALILLAFGLLSGLAYYFLGDKLAKRQGDLANVTDNNNPNSKAAAPTPYPTAVPGVENKQPEVKQPVADNPKPAATLPATTAQQPDNSKVIPIPPKEPDGSKGHSKSTPPASAAAPPTPKNGSLTIQVASFNDQAQANDRVSRLGQSKVEARVVQADVGGKTWYRVQIGGFKSREEATEYARKLKAQGVLQDFIVTTVGK